MEGVSLNNGFYAFDKRLTKHYNEILKRFFLVFNVEAIIKFLYKAALLRQLCRDDGNYHGGGEGKGGGVKQFE